MPFEPHHRQLGAVTGLVPEKPALKLALRAGRARAKEVKQVHFGGLAVRTVSRWIED